MDNLDTIKRHNNMAAIRSKNTKPEMVVRKYLHARGFRYRLFHRRLPGHPDLVMRKYRTCIFVHGCFWHGHDNCKAFRMPKTNVDFWTRKITRNKQRDHETMTQLATLGWHCIVIWECELKPSVRQQTLTALEYTLNRIYLKDHSTHYVMIEQDKNIGMAAEPSINHK